MLIPASLPTVPAIPIDSRRDLLRTSQLALTGELVRAIVHDLRQPVTSVTVNVELAMDRLRRRPSDIQGALAALTDVLDGGQQMGTSLRVLHNLVAHRSPDRTLVALQRVLTEAVGLVQTEANARRVRITVIAASDLPASSVDIAMIRQAILSMLLDAVENARPADDVRVQLSLPTAGVVELSIRHVRRADAPIEDAWALSVARWVAEAHGVALEVESDGNGEVRVRSRWPADAPTSQSTQLS